MKSNAKKIQTKVIESDLKLDNAVSTYKLHESVIPQKVVELNKESKKYFRNQLAEFVYYRTYSRWIDDEGRRETWIETVDRYINFMKKNLGNKLTEEEYTEIREGILKQESMPSMRLLQFAGVAAENTNVCAYNCSYIAPERFRDFGEIMYILMCGTGVGFSAEKKNVDKLPVIKKQTGEKLETFVIPDSREGWADSLILGLETWFNGKDIEFDFSQLRPAGARLKTFGGRASGPDPLVSLLKFARERILSKQGGKLSTLDIHDLVCKIGEVVVSGGVRRSALISLSDLNDKEMRDAKSGEFWNENPQRSMANNSAVYSEKPSTEQFLEEWIALMKSGTGERGIFNRAALEKTLPKRRLDYLHNDVSVLGTNPCGEILLQSRQFCNLSEIVARADDTEETLLKKIRRATILGTYQSTLTNFKYLSEDWKKHCEEERLLGVSITGQYDCSALRNPETLRKLRDMVRKTNEEYSKRFGISLSTCTTCVKPSGNASQTVDCASGMHPRYGEYYIRRVRIAQTDPLFQMMKDQGVPFYPEVGQDPEKANTWVLEFPVEAPKDSVYKDDLTALEQLEYWKMVKENYTEHNPSITIYVGEDEWIEVGNWVYQNWDIAGGISFLPRSNHVYQLAPYEEIDREKYLELKEAVGEIDFSLIVAYEKEDATEVKKELACAGGACEI